MAFNHFNFNSANYTNTQALEAFSMNNASSFALQHDVTVTTPSAGTFTAAVTDICAKVGHGMLTGLKVRVSTTTTLPAGLAAVTDYYVIADTVDTFKLASSLAFALAGTAIDITDTGTGTHTVTPTALAGGVIKMQESVDGTNWYDISGVTANITATGIAKLEGTTKCGQVRPYLTMTAGQLTLVLKANTKT
jgi:hypothetical protein